MSEQNDKDPEITRTYQPLTPGTSVSHYRIEKKIGAGGMGEVYLAKDTELERKVALKFLPSHFETDQSLTQRFRREAQAAARLNHPNIVQIFQVSEGAGVRRSYLSLLPCDSGVAP